MFPTLSERKSTGSDRSDDRTLCLRSQHSLRNEHGARANKDGDKQFSPEFRDVMYF